MLFLDGYFDYYVLYDQKDGYYGTGHPPAVKFQSTQIQ
jgi:hypothetical protein